VDAHEVTLAMSRANMSLNIARTVLDRVVRAWRDLINTR
jgi:flagellar hook-basal body complex protein FliE